MRGLTFAALALQALVPGAFGKNVSPIAAPCMGDGPSVQVLSLDHLPGKPPNSNFRLDMRVRNPLPTAVWLFCDMRDPPTLVTGALLWKTRDDIPFFFWTLSGDRRATALRIPMKADVLLTGLKVSSVRQKGPPPMVFARDVRIAGQSAPSWLGHAGMNPAQGESALDSADLVTQRELDGLEGAKIRIDVLCVQQVDAQAAGAAP